MRLSGPYQVSVNQTEMGNEQVQEASRGMRALRARAMAVRLCAGTDAKKIVEAANTTWNKAFNGKDGAGVAALYEKDATLSAGDGTYIQGRAEIEKLFKGYFDAGAHDHALQVIDARRNGNMVYEVANWSAAVDKDGKHTDYKGVVVKVMTLDNDGKWRTTAHVWNVAH
jgi:uncharacterized protein (TIGR02246 family)